MTTENTKSNSTALDAMNEVLKEAAEHVLKIASLAVQQQQTERQVG